MDKWNLDKLENAKDNLMGKVIETAGKMTNDKEMEFTGKFQSVTSKVKDQLYDVKEDVYQVGNQLLDKVEERLDKKDQQGK